MFQHDPFFKGSVYNQKNAGFHVSCNILFEPNRYFFGGGPANIYLNKKMLFFLVLSNSLFKVLKLIIRFFVHHPGLTFH